MVGGSKEGFESDGEMESLVSGGLEEGVLWRSKELNGSSPSAKLLARTATSPGFPVFDKLVVCKCKLVLSGNAQLQHRHMNILAIWCVLIIWDLSVSLPKVYSSEKMY